MKQPKLRYSYDLDGKKTEVIIPGKQFAKIEDKLEDYHTYKVVTERRKKKEPTYSFEEVKRATNKRKK